MSYITFRFLATLKDLVGNSEVKLELNKETSLLKLFDCLEEKADLPIKKIIRENFSDYKNTMIILVNDKEINTLNGLNTIVKNGDIVTFIPVVHGG
ncbi:MAG: MoaD/ThiS family protein [Candidatus Odinarchaeia archaeon]